MTDYLKVTKSVTDAIAPYYEGRLARAKSRFEGSQIRENARESLRVGERTAGVIRQQGRRTYGDAKLAMIAQGGTIDSEMLERIKRDSEIDAISAMYDAKADATTQRMQARQIEREGDQARRASVIKVGSSLLKTASSFNDNKPKYKPPPGPHKGVRTTPTMLNYNRKR